MLQEILDHLLEKYNPKAVFFHGSRVRNMANSLSDWDFTLIVNQETKTVSENFRGANLDIIPITLPLEDGQYINFEGIPINPLKLLYDENFKLGEKLLVKTEQVFLEGPQKLDENKFVNEINFLKRCCVRLNTRGKDLICRNYSLSIFYSASIKLWFSINRYWMVPIYIGTSIIEKEAPILYKNLQYLFAYDYYERSLQIIEFLEKNYLKMNKE